MFLYLNNTRVARPIVWRENLPQLYTTVLVFIYLSSLRAVDFLSACHHRSVSHRIYNEISLCKSVKDFAAYEILYATTKKEKKNWSESLAAENVCAHEKLTRLAPSFLFKFAFLLEHIRASL